MTNRWIRFLLAVLAIAAASAAAYRVVESEQRLRQHTASAQRATAAAHTASVSIEELKAALHAYVAPGQDPDYWTTIARRRLDIVRSELLKLDAEAASAHATVAQALDACDRLSSAEQRATAHVRDEQARLAGEVIFTEARDSIDVMRSQIDDSLRQITDSAQSSESGIRREQTYLLAGGAGVLALVMLLLVPTGRAAAIAAPDPVQETDPTCVVASDPVPSDPVAPEPIGPELVASAPAPEPQLDAPALATICQELAALSDSEQIPRLLERTRALLEARGLVVWMSTPDRAELHAAAVSGYDARMVARIGTIGRSATNLTADAFRANAVRTSAASDTAAAAFAIPMPAPDGPAGVFSAELASGAAIDEAKLSAARVIAAQLGTMLGGATPKRQDAAGDAPSAAAAQSSP